MEQEYLLKNRLRDLIAGREVKAALFYTFNFDPKFFENYVMPLLVPQQTFINNSITNNIIWRRLYKDNKVPPITVYFNQDAKSTEVGPYLDYKLVAVNMPMVGKNKGNFHPKNSFILVQNQDKSNELIVVTGSNNITQPGWCENIECVSDHQLISGREFPYEFRKSVKDFIEYTFNDFGKNWSDAEGLIVGYLNKLGYTKEREYFFYNSYYSSFSDFLEGHVLWDDSIKTAEIISPFFKKNPDLLNILTRRKIQVKIQAPVKNDHLILDEEIYKAYKLSGVKWYYPDDDKRSTHSKVYRLYGAENVYTIIGSVNLTNPAWKGYSEKPKEIYNIESAILYIEKEGKPVHLFKREVKEEHLKFLPANQESENWHERLEIPEINFTVNWIEKTLAWKSKAKNECQLHLSDSEILKIHATETISLTTLKNGDAIINSIARKPVLRVTENLGDKEQVHYYYANQIGFESRPLEFRLSATDIIDAWELLGKENIELNDWFINVLETVSDKAQDDSGKLILSSTENKSLLNEMARHFYGLVKLEEFLFSEDVLKRSNGQQSVHYNNLRYYLTCDNVDTLYSYIRDMGKLHSDKKVMTVYYWLILNIVSNKFYKNKLLGKMMRQLFTDNINTAELKKVIQQVDEEIINEIRKVERDINLDKKKMKWALSVLQEEYGVS